METADIHARRWSVSDELDIGHEVPEPHWHRDVRFGYWAHWDPQTVPESSDGFAMHMYTPGSDQYKWTVNKFGNLNEYGYNCRMIEHAK